MDLFDFLKILLEESIFMIGKLALLDRWSCPREGKEAKTSERNGQQKSAKENPLLQRAKETDVYFFFSAKSIDYQDWESNSRPRSSRRTVGIVYSIASEPSTQCFSVGSIRS
jgi:hypothetical protein